MRARSYTLYSKQAPLKKADSSPPTSTSPTSKSTPSTTSSRYTADYLASIFDSFGPISECRVKDVFAGDFQSTCPVIPDNLSSISTSIGDLRSRGASYISCDDYLEEMELEEHKPNKVSRIMVIGTGNVEKYAVINRIYPQEDDIATQDNAKFDLITRKIEKDMETERYHFWVREAGQGQRRHGALFNVYYRSCEVFFLVYNEDDRQSFEVLEREIQMIQEAKGDKEVKLVLISNKGRKSEVREEEVRGLKDKYKVKMHIEGDEIEGKEEEIREMIAEMMK